MRDVEPVLEYADDQPGHDVDAGDEHGRQRVALREPNGAVHRAVKIGLAPDSVAPLTRFLVVDDTGIQVGVNRHLPPGHRVEGESRRDFRDADRAVVDDHELDDHEHGENHHAHDEAAADDELAERHDHVARRVDAVRAVQQHETRGRDVQGEPHQREQQEQ